MALIPMNSEEFEAAVASGQAVMVYFWTDWHDICQEATPIMEEVAQRFEGEAIVCSINADAEGFLALDLGAYSIPTVILYHGGEEIERIGGMQPADLYASLLDSCLHPEEINPYDMIQSYGYS